MVMLNLLEVSESMMYHFLPQLSHSLPVSCSKMIQYHWILGPHFNFGLLLLEAYGRIPCNFYSLVYLMFVQKINMY